MSRVGFEAAAQAVAVALGPTRTKDLAGLLARGRGSEHALSVLQSPASAGPVAALYRAADSEAVPYREAAAYLRGYVAASTRRRDEAEVRTVWSGPSTPGVPVRATAQVLAEVIREARTELLAMTYSARPYPALTRALADAVARGVEAHIVVETLSGAGGLLEGPEPAEAFAKVPGVSLWQWARTARGRAQGRQHAKLAVADGRLLYLGSANLTESAARRNLEAGVLVRGGTAPRRAAEHIKALRNRGILTRFNV
jgi:phosphatidylserine/phosphatidylglycerophosphate/cardiolipin synthase-like enzyme